MRIVCFALSFALLHLPGLGLRPPESCGRNKPPPLAAAWLPLLCCSAAAASPAAARLLPRRQLLHGCCRVARCLGR
jgi:hypothetical protein